MRVTEGTICLFRPIAGHHRLVGPVTIGTTWLEYTLPEEAHVPGAADTGGESSALAGHRLLIPITNVIAVVIPPDADDAYRPPLP
jgi:hypothetical protein